MLTSLWCFKFITQESFHFFSVEQARDCLLYAIADFIEARITLEELENIMSLLLFDCKAIRKNIALSGDALELENILTSTFHLDHDIAQKPDEQSVVEVLTDIGLFYQSWTKNSELPKWKFTDNKLRIIARKQITKYCIQEKEKNRI